ncbi:NAD kinase 2, mitochondrial [Tetranychus urticae]|uniref:Uncharacterized protein n=1 Tax=Tetranychus urticae TaxID=32264 RepID=T1L1M6_TETUR|nr:NAD kinase 2, mitochondrial [Tetranychus urticae]XP_015792982.1 NAD kinase 2, mitochondrial [Tetranychus urticae]
MNYIFSLCRPWKLVLSANYLKPTCDFFPTAKNIVKCNYKMSSSSSDLIEDQPVKGDTFHSKKALILTKFSRYEFEKRTNPNLTEEQLIDKLQRRGSDYRNLLHHHQIHCNSRDKLKLALEKRGLEVRMVNRLDYNKANVDWADVIFTSGGDGTFLMAASHINSPDKPIIGINSDPSRSVGHLCLPVQYSNDLDLMLDKLYSNKFKWFYRQRIRVTLEGVNAEDDPIELHNQQLMYPEYRYLEADEKMMCDHAPGRVSPCSPPHTSFASQSENVSKCSKNQGNKIIQLPVRALNECFVGESCSSRVSYYEFSVDGTPRYKFKSSGVTICTGTGSTSWSFNINRLTVQNVKQLFQIIHEETGQNISSDEETVKSVTKRFNDSLIFDASKPTMAYTVRDPIVTGSNDEYTRGFASKIEIRSRMFDACVVIDGGLSYRFNDGTVAKFEIYEEDALKTVQLFS